MLGILLLVTEGVMGCARAPGVAYPGAQETVRTLASANECDARGSEAATGSFPLPIQYPEVDGEAC